MLPASTLAETLVVMILTGIVLLSVFDGFSLFERLLRRMQGDLEESMDRAESLHRLQSLFAGADSIRGDAFRMELYRQGEIREEIAIDDSLLIIRRPGMEVSPDTVLRRVSDPRIVRNPDHPERIDSLHLLNDTIPLRFGFRPQPQQTAEENARKIEEDYENR